MTAKLDTGAQTSAIHAFRIRRFTRDEQKWVRFEVHPVQRTRRNAQVVEARVVDERVVKSSNGVREKRPVIRTTCQMGGLSWRVYVTLTSRTEMTYRLLLGRSALRGRFLVDSSRSYLLDK